MFYEIVILVLMVCFGSIIGIILGLVGFFISECLAEKKKKKNNGW
jgi:uncharacterized membrane protein